MARRARNAAGDLLEAPFQQQVEGIASFYGWLIYHTHRSDRSKPGFPDLVLVRGRELIFAELKTRTGRVSREQQTWLDALEHVHLAVMNVGMLADDDADEPLGDLPIVDVYIWRPDDWDAIQERLARGRHRVPAMFDPR